MLLLQTTLLLNTYARSLSTDDISDQQLSSIATELLAVTFTKSQGYVDPEKPVTEANYSQNDAIKEFVRVIGATLPPQVLHRLTEFLIAKAPDQGVNTFMRNSTVEKVFLAYEMATQPEAAETHFELDRIKETFSGPNDISNLKRVILNLLVQGFQALASEEIALECAYLKNLNLLKNMNQPESSDNVHEKTNQLINYIEKLKDNGKVSVSSLITVLENTQQLLQRKMSVADYNTSAAAIEEKRSTSTKILSSLMIAVSIAVAAAGFIIAGAAIAAVGVGFFAKKPGQLANAMLHVAKTQDEQEPDPQITELS